MSALQASDRNLELRVDDHSGRLLIVVRDAENGNVIRQIPSEEVLALSRSLDRMHSLLLDDTA